MKLVHGSHRNRFAPLQPLEDANRVLSRHSPHLDLSLVNGEVARVHNPHARLAALGSEDRLGGNEEPFGHTNFITR